MAGWQSKGLEECLEKVKYPTKIHRKKFLGEGDFPIVSQEQDFINGYWADEQDVFKVKKPVVIFGDHTKVLKYVDFDFVLGADGVKILQPKNFLYPKFFYYFLNAFPVKALGYARHYRLLKELKVLYPESLPEQKRIVAILDEAFAAIDTAVANTEKNLANARELFESYLNDVFTRKGDGWVEKTVGELADHCLGKMLDKKKNKGALEPYLRNLNVRWFNFNLSDLLEMRFEVSEVDRYSAQKGDVLICEGGYPGRAAIWPHDETIFFQKALHRVRFKEPIHNRWFMYYLYLSDSTGNLRQYFTGAGIQHFTGQALKRFKLPIATVPEIKQHVERFDSLHGEIQHLESVYQQKLTALIELKQSILQKAFAGELTTQPETEVAEAIA